MIKKFRMLIPQSIKSRIKAYIGDSHTSYLYQYANYQRKKVFVFLAGFYQNLGDMAITYSQIRFLESIFPEAKVIAIPSTQTYKSIKAIKEIIRPDDIITINGGGNIGDLYVSLEQARLYVIKSFPHNKIISFPQTLVFTDTKYGRKQVRISRRIYEKHTDLTIFVRERNSLEKIKRIFPAVNIGFCPDIVLFLNKYEPNSERSNIVCCMRNDKEKQITNEETYSVESIVCDLYPGVIFKDTVDVSFEDCTPERYEHTLEEFWNLLRHSKLVITDRLHCMLFCVITGTPCIVIDNNNRKISGVYDAWLSDIDFVILLREYNPELLRSAINSLVSRKLNNIYQFETQNFKSLEEACIY